MKVLLVAINPAAIVSRKQSAQINIYMKKKTLIAVGMIQVGIIKSYTWIIQNKVTRAKQKQAQQACGTLRILIFVPLLI